MRFRVRLDQIRKQDSGQYSCRSDTDEWANITIVVDAPFPDKMEIQSLVAENLQLADQVTDDHANTGLDENETYGTEVFYPDPDEPQKPHFKRESELHRLIAKPSGNMFRFRCLVEGNPEPNITWTKNGEKIERKMGKVKQQKYAITLEELVPDDSGLYKCEACNPSGCVDWSTKLEVQGNAFVISFSSKKSRFKSQNKTHHRSFPRQTVC